MRTPSRYRSSIAAVLLASALLASCAGPTTGSPTADPTAAGTGDEPDADQAAETPTETSAGASTAPTLSTPTTSARTPTEPTDEAPPTTGPDPAGEAAETYVYFVVDTGTEVRLTREAREVPAANPAAPTAPAVVAVETMIAGPLDPDYSTTWNPDTAVRSVTVADDVITVDLSAAARTANVGSGGAAMMVQQLVWTVTDALGLPAASVLLTLDGAPADELWGVLDWDAPMDRAAPEQVRALVQIDIPAEGAAVTSPVTIVGDAAAFEAHLAWQVLDATGAEVAAGSTMTNEGMTFAPFEFTVELPAGSYTVAVHDPGGGGALPPYLDDRSFTVTG